MNHVLLPFPPFPISHTKQRNQKQKAHLPLTLAGGLRNSSIRTRYIAKHRLPERTSRQQQQQHMPFAILQFWQSRNIQVRVRSVYDTVNHRNPQKLDVLHQSFGYIAMGAVGLRWGGAFPPVFSGGGRNPRVKQVPHFVRDDIFCYLLVLVIFCFCIFGIWGLVARHSRQSSRSEGRRPIPRLFWKESPFSAPITPNQRVIYWPPRPLSWPT
jgi:hypothetical protein